MEFYKESANETKETTGELVGWMSQYDIAKACNWDLAIRGHQVLLENLLKGLESNTDWDESNPYEASMKQAGELRYYFSKEMIATNKRIKTTADREIGKLNKTGKCSSNCSSCS
jgi:hypothetical protein